MVRSKDILEVVTALNNAQNNTNTTRSQLVKAEQRAYEIFYRLATFLLRKFTYSSNEVKSYVVTDVVTRCMTVAKEFNEYYENVYLGLTKDKRVISYSKKDKDVKVSYPVGNCLTMDKVPLKTVLDNLELNTPILIKNDAFSYFSCVVLNTASTAIKLYKSCGDVPIVYYGE